MEKASSISSEEELQALRNEGKISDAEYRELRDAMHRPSWEGAEAAVIGNDQGMRTYRLGKIAFYLMLAGIVVPVLVFLICFTITGGGEGDVIVSVCFFLSVLIEIPAFVVGVISWPDVFGKAAVITIAVVTVLALLFVS